MRLSIAAICGFFLAAALIGCGGASIPSAPENAKPGPPPGTSVDMLKAAKKK